MTVLPAFFWVLAIALTPRFERRPFSISERSAKVRRTWHCPLVSWWIARPPCAIKRTPIPQGRGLAMHSPVWIETRTLCLPGDTTPVELNAHP